jgi:myo-inositol-1-phosphate synthase
VRCFAVSNDFTSGQNKFKIPFTEFPITAGIKSKTIAGYNQLSNSDGKIYHLKANLNQKKIQKLED